MDGNSESGILVIVPLKSSENVIFGACGIEVSSMLFKKLYCPADSDYSSMFVTFSKSVDNTLQLSNGMIAGNSYLTGKNHMQNVTFSKEKNSFMSYIDKNRLKYGGLHENLYLYSKNSPYNSDAFSVGLLMSEPYFSNTLKSNSIFLYLMLIILFVFSLLAAFIISSKYLKPITDSLKQIKSGSYNVMPKNTYLEINDLMEFLSTQDLEREKANSSKVPFTDITLDSATYENFIKNINTLSPAERTVFNLYLKGHTAQEITDILCLSINTIKTHNRRIFSKLNVSSRKELMIYINRMEELKSDD